MKKVIDTDKFRKNPMEERIDPKNPEDHIEQQNRQKAVSLTYSDGWFEIFTGFALFIWLVYLILPIGNIYLLYSLLIVIPLLMALLLLLIRKNRTFLLTMELTDFRIDLISFVNFFLFIFLLGLGFFAVISLENNFEVRSYIIYLPLIIASFTGIYYFIIAAKFKIIRFNISGFVILISGCLMFFLLNSLSQQLLLIFAVLAFENLLFGSFNRIRRS